MQLCIASGPETPTQIILDVDTTDDPTHGQQQLGLYHGYYETYCYLPLLVYAQVDDGPQQLVAAVLRPGNVHASHGAVSILKRLVHSLRKAWPEVGILLRADSGLAVPAVYDWCEDNTVEYLMGLARNPRLAALAEPLMLRARQQHIHCGARVRRFQALEYAAETWRQQRRVIVKAEVTLKGDNPRFVVTSIRDRSPAELYALYAQRAEAENRIKELKNDLRSGRTSCHRFLANQFRLLLHAAAFVLLSLLRRLLEGTELAVAQAGTLRLRLLKVGLRVQESTRKVWLHFASAYPWQHLWPLLLARLRTGYL